MAELKRLEMGEIFCYNLFMVVTYFGNGSFRLQSGETSILLDPENNRLKADVILRTLVPTGSDSEKTEESDAISFPGEYEIKGIEIIGFPIASESTEKFLKTAYAVIWEEMKFVFL